MKVIDRVYRNNEQDKRDAVALLGQKVAFTDFANDAIENIGNEYPFVSHYFGCIDKLHGITPFGYAASVAEYNCIFTLKEIEEYVVFDKDSPPEEVIKYLGKEAQFSDYIDFNTCIDSIFSAYQYEHSCSIFKAKHKYGPARGGAYVYMRIKK